MSTKPILWPRAEWEWFGRPGHFICARWCRFHLTTLVGPWLVSTVGAFVHPRHSQGSEQKEAQWLAKNWPGEDIGVGRKFETMVFRAGEPCAENDCHCELPRIDGRELEAKGYQTFAEAQRGHVAMCERWARMGEEGPR